MSMRILYVVSRSLQINTSASVRNRATIMGLVENGHEVDLVTSLPDENHMAFDKSMTLEGVNIIYIKLSGVQSVARLGRKLKFFEPLKRLVISYMDSHNIYDNLQGIVDHVGEINASKYDLIISSSDPKSSHLFVDKLIQKGKYSGRWIQIWGDPFFSDITLPKNARKNDILKEEKRLIMACDRVVYVSKLTLGTQRRLYPDCAKKMIYSPIPFLNEIKEPIKNYSQGDKICLAYCGDYASNVRNIIPLYSAIKEINKNVELVICGNSDLNLEQANNIQIMGRQPYEVVEKIEKEADILVHISNLHGGQIPGKIYQYSGTNKPILFILDGEKDLIRNQFEQYGRYCFADNTKDSILRVLDSLIIENREYDSVKDFSKSYIAANIVNALGDNDGSI